MAHVHRPRPWDRDARAVAPPEVFFDRRRFLRSSLAAGVLPLLPALGCAKRTPGAAAGPGDRSAVAGGGAAAGGSSSFSPAFGKLFPPPRDDSYPLPGGVTVTPEEAASSYNNFYEFGTDKRLVRERVRDFRPWRWQVLVEGEVAKPATFDVDDLAVALGIEERVLRFRCVEAWAMAVPWDGFPLRRLLERVEPKSSARFVRFVSFLRPDEAPGQRDSSYPWPYYEGLTIDEAMCDLAFLAVGAYGHPLPPQHGAPIRLVVPWKYGFKSIKSIVRIELVRERPPTFWSDLVPSEYDFFANVDPTVPHPRWSQATERWLPDFEVRPTLPYNGYGPWVAHLYDKG